MSYFLMWASEDGQSTETFTSKEELLEAISGEPYFGDDGPVEFLDHFPEFNQVQGNKVLIVKGEIVIPEPKSVVVSFDVE